MERREYPRIQTPLHCRPAGLSSDHETIDVSLTGARVYGDEEYKPGTRVKMEFFTDATGPVTYTAEIVWVESLAPGAPAKFDIGLKFVDMGVKGLQFLAAILVPEGDPEA